MNIGLVLAIAGFAVTLLGLPIMRANWTRARSDQSLSRFRQVLDQVRTGHSQLNALTLSESETVGAVVGLPVLAKEGWILDEPTSLESVRLVMLKASPNDYQVTVARRHAQRLMPRRTDGSRYQGFSQTLIELGEMPHLYNGVTYRPVGVNATSGGLEITLTTGKYFDHLDTTTVLAYETAARLVSGRKRIQDGRYRRYVDDPFDLTRRTTGLGINTLTVRRGQNGCGFYMHRRNGRWVAEGSELIHTVPAGEFTPSDVGLQAQEDDLNLWRNIMREYAEEFLDMEEAYGRGGRPINYAEQAPFKQLDQARKNGDLKAYLLGVGLDPLDWKPALFTICVFEAKAFDAIFADIVVDGKEGTILVGPDGFGIPFNARFVHMYADDRNTTNAGTVNLRLAWHHRVALGIAGS
ncbi:hypothetical protein ACFQ1S_01460 [Kibdelosporangium lantanae]|uniref:Uncharacterized protein n=1 Tax=Kibdelosporangium lantanae TaxID=1497396 RepID=A0ABW3M241_9PSEU